MIEACRSLTQLTGSSFKSFLLIPVYTPPCVSCRSHKKFRNPQGFRTQKTAHTASHILTLKQTLSAIARSISTYCVRYQQSPGLKSDILHGNYLTNCQQPSASSHIIIVYIKYTVQSRKYYYTLLLPHLQAVTDKLQYRIFTDFSAHLYAHCTNFTMSIIYCYILFIFVVKVGFSGL